MAGKTDLVRLINKAISKHSKEEGLEHITATHLDIIAEVIVEQVRAGERVVIQGFGAFYKKLSNPRITRNPYQNTELKLPARARLDFKPIVDGFEVSDEDLSILNEKTKTKEHNKVERSKHVPKELVEIE
jgi:nucleoid DNA-binding protein